LEKYQLLLFGRRGDDSIGGGDFGADNLLVVAFVGMQLFAFQVPQSDCCVSGTG
jgi:hypothetical protein